MDVTVPTRDVAVVGASLAGCAAAITLAQQGFSVTVIDRDTFPRQKSCGEGFSHLGQKYLSLLGIQPDCCTQEENEFFGYRFVRSGDLPLTKGHFVAHTKNSRGWGVSRHTLDAALVQRALEFPNVVVALGQAALRSNWHSDKWHIATSTHEFVSKFLIVAAGARNTFLSLPYVEEVKAPSSRVGYTLLAHISGGELPKLVSLIPLPSGEIYVTRLGCDRANVSLVGTSSFIQEYRNNRTLSSILHARLGLLFSFSERGIGASNFESRHISNHPHLYLVGDSIESFDPACGLGMTHALASGISAAQHIQQVLSGITTSSEALVRYHQAHDTSARGIRRYSGSIQKLIWLFRKTPSLFMPFSGSLGGLAVCALEKTTRPLRAARPSTIMTTQVR